MAYPKNFGFNQVTVSSAATTAVSGNNVAIRVPFRSQIMKVGACIGSAIATADGSLAVSVLTNGTTLAVSLAGSSAITLTSTLSQAGLVFSATPTTATFVGEDDSIIFAVTGSSTSGGVVQYFADLKEA